MKSATENETRVTLRLSPNMVAANKANFVHKLLLIDRQVSSPSRTCKETFCD